VQTLNKFKERRQRLKLAGVQPQIRKVLTLTRLDQMFELADSVESAVE
jgi:anti-anti-sigma regulatory factor